MQRIAWLMLVSLCLATGSVAAAELEVITLKYRSAEQLIPVIRPLLAAGGTVSGMQNQLIVRTSRQNLEEIRKVLASLDAMPRRLMITVRQSAEGTHAQSGAELSGQLGAVSVGSAPPGPERRELTARVYETHGATDDRITQRIQVLEGNAATIQIGESVPVPAQTRSVGGVIFSDSVAYRDFESGFEVVPRVSGERVFLDISPRRETPTGNLGGAKVQRALSVVSGRLGEWFELGGSIGTEARSDSGLLLGAAAQRKDKRSVWVKVEEIE